MATFLAGRIASLTGPSWAANAQNWRLSSAVELPDATVLGATYDDHVIGIKGRTISCEVLYDSGVDIITMRCGLAIGTVTLIPDAVGDATTTISGPGTIVRVDWTQDRRGVSMARIDIKSNGSWAWAESAP